MDSQLEAIQERVCTVEGRLVKAEQDLAAAKEAKNGEHERLFELTGRSARGEHSPAWASIR